MSLLQLLISSVFLCDFPYFKLKSFLLQELIKSLRSSLTRYLEQSSWTCSSFSDRRHLLISWLPLSLARGTPPCTAPTPSTLLCPSLSSICSRRPKEKTSVVFMRWNVAMGELFVLNCWNAFRDSLIWISQILLKC